MPRTEPTARPGPEPRRPDDLADALTLADAARLLGVSVRTVQRYVARGHLAVFYLPSGRPRIPLGAVSAVRRSTTPPADRRPGRR